MVLHHRSRLTRLKSGSQLAEQAYYWKMEPQHPYVHRIRETCRQELIRNARTVVNYSTPPSTPVEGSLSLSLSFSHPLSLAVASTATSHKPRSFYSPSCFPNGWYRVSLLVSELEQRCSGMLLAPEISGSKSAAETSVRAGSRGAVEDSDGARVEEKGPGQIISPANGAWD